MLSNPWLESILYSNRKNGNYSDAKKSRQHIPIHKNLLTLNGIYFFRTDIMAIMNIPCRKKIKK